ncbi:PAAR-like domain-containing protein [Paracoccus sp. (in: a-proteobacteria)]|uniref:PAAR-like domain-containing protein n=1 Tax=Paracoccus sp. TaxID=267 RepID=UPI003A84BF76
MSNNGSARKDGTNFIASTGPDVCWTPVGSKMKKVSYSSIAFLNNAVRVNNTVRWNGRPDFMQNSRTPNSFGTEPGVGRGVVKSGHLGPATGKVLTGSVFSSGWASTRHKDPAVINMPSLGPREGTRT